MHGLGGKTQVPQSWQLVQGSETVPSEASVANKRTSVGTDPPGSCGDPAVASIRISESLAHTHPGNPLPTTPLHTHLLEML